MSTHNCGNRWANRYVCCSRLTLPYANSCTAVRSYLELTAVQSSSNLIFSAQASIREGQHNPGKWHLWGLEKSHLKDFVCERTKTVRLWEGSAASLFMMWYSWLRDGHGKQRQTCQCTNSQEICSSVLTKMSSVHIWQSNAMVCLLVVQATRLS